jgi:hypothetical protein
MKSGLLPALLLLFFSLSAFGKEKKADKKTAAQLKAEVYYLASDSLEGRRTGSVGEHKAADYIIARYEELGIQGYKGQYKYPFNFIYGKEILDATQIKIGNNYAHIKDEAFPLPFSANKSVSGEALPDVNEEGNIWILSLYGSEDESKDPHFDAEKVMYDRSKDAITHGAKGVLFYDSYGSKYAPEFNALSQLEALDIPVAFIGFSAWQAYADKNKTSGNLPIILNVDIKKSERVGTNIAAYIDNSAKYTVVLGAHYDHLGYGEDGNSLYAGKDKQIHNGADDNASGTAALLEIAGWIKKHHLHHYNYLFINFSGEELGLLGSKAFIKDQHIDSSQIDYMINMDMVGRLNDSTHALTVGGIGTSTEWAKLLAKPNKNFKLNFDSSGVGPSDHTSFYLDNIPVLFFFTGTHKDYHKPSDDADKINYNGEVSVMHYIYYFVSSLEKEPKLAFTVTKQSSVGRVAFKVTLGIMPDYSYQDKGVRVDGVSEDRPAKRAGLKEGDIIVQLGAYKVQGMQSYMEALGKFNKGDATKVTVMRNGQQMILPIQFDK